MKLTELIFYNWKIWMSVPEDTGGDFFCHICSDYVGYEERK